MSGYQLDFIKRIKERIEKENDQDVIAIPMAHQPPTRQQVQVVIDSELDKAEEKEYNDQAAFLKTIPNKYVFESSEFDHLAELEFEDIYRHVFLRHLREH